MEQYTFQQNIIPLSKKPDKDGFIRANFNVEVQRREADFSDTTLTESVEGFIFDDYGIHVSTHALDKNDVKITYLPLGRKVISVNHWTMGFTQKELTVAKAKAIAKAMVKRFPLPVPEGIAVEQKRQSTLGGETLEYTVVVLREEYAKQMSEVIAEERREFTRFR